MAVQMELSRIFIREMTDMQIIELSEVEGDRTFPIVIGLPEAFAIERRLKGVQIERPQTHDLLAAVIDALGGELRHIVVNDLSDGTFFAKLIIRQGDRDIEIDSRPSDAIALAVAGDAGIFVEEHVLEQTAQDSSAAAADADDETDDDELEDFNWD